MKQDTDMWQDLMDRIYDRWNKNRDWNYDRMLLSCNGREKVAVLIGNLNYQVKNGGFQQWVDNGYALKGKEVCMVLVTIANEMGCPLAAELAGRIDKLLEHVDLNKKNKGWNIYWRKDPTDDYDWDDEEDRYHEGMALANSMDDWFYKTVEPQLTIAVTKWLEQTKD